MISFPILWENCQFDMIGIVDPLTSRTNEHVWLLSSCVLTFPRFPNLQNFTMHRNLFQPLLGSGEIRWKPGEKGERWKPGPSGEKGGEVTCASSAPPEAWPASPVAPPPASWPSPFEQLLASSVMKCMRNKFRIECMLKIWSDLLLLYHQSYSSALHWPLEHRLKSFPKI